MKYSEVKQKLFYLYVFLKKSKPYSEYQKNDKKDKIFSSQKCFIWNLRLLSSGLTQRLLQFYLVQTDGFGEIQITIWPENNQLQSKSWRNSTSHALSFKP